MISAERPSLLVVRIGIRTLTAGLIQKGWFSGTLLIARGPDVLLAMAGGEADRSFHVPNNIDTKFNLGSMNKMLTAPAGAQPFAAFSSRFMIANMKPAERTQATTRIVHSAQSGIRIHR